MTPQSSFANGEVPAPRGEIIRVLASANAVQWEARIKCAAASAFELMEGELTAPKAFGKPSMSLLNGKVVECKKLREVRGTSSHMFLGSYQEWLCANSVVGFCAL